MDVVTALNVKPEAAQNVHYFLNHYPRFFQKIQNVGKFAMQRILLLPDARITWIQTTYFYIRQGLTTVKWYGYLTLTQFYKTYRYPVPLILKQLSLLYNFPNLKILPVKKHFYSKIFNKGTDRYLFVAYRCVFIKK